LPVGEPALRGKCLRMANLKGGEESKAFTAQCKHAPEMAPTLELSGPRGEQLRMFSCWRCQHRWWQDNSEVVDLSVVLSVMGDIVRTPRRLWR